ncbi:GATA transcription factor [Striga asiatica]|uniref:GATA transcription factor n=1 Tax=Striga asiatica TaxID=4170 RepID=A0A5A7R8I3_STRAF|nr:GATA transcription factor [Striga asiatica]
MEYFSGDYAELSSADNVDFNATGAHFTVDDLLEFSKDDETIADAFPDGLAGNSGDSSTVTAVDSCNSSVSGSGGSASCRSFNEMQFSGDELCIPYDDLADLEWLSNFVEESFSAGGGTTVATNSSSSSSTLTTTTHYSPPPPPPLFFPADASVPGKARSKRSRAAPCDWSSRLFVLSPKAAPARRREPADAPGRRCLHCASEKTPQWRTGPMGPKTLCNACGVRYKSGRLVPEYRPAASPTFVSAKHSNSHRKVMELRRLKEVQIRRAHVNHQMFNGCDEFLIHQHSNINGLDFRHMI